MQAAGEPGEGAAGFAQVRLDNGFLFPKDHWDVWGQGLGRRAPTRPSGAADWPWCSAHLQQSPSLRTCGESPLRSEADAAVRSCSAGYWG